MLRSLRGLHNAVFDERIVCYRTMGRALTVDQYKSLAAIRRDPLGFGALDAGLVRSLVARLDRSMNAFFRRLRHGKAAGFPRFRSRYVCIDVLMPRKPTLHRSDGSWKLVVKGLSPITIKPGRAPPDVVPKAIRIVRRVTGVTVELVYEVANEPLAPVAGRVGVVVGVGKRMAFSTGESRAAGSTPPGRVQGPAQGSDPLGKQISSGKPGTDLVLVHPFRQQPAQTSCPGEAKHVVHRRLAEPRCRSHSGYRKSPVQFEHQDT